MVALSSLPDHPSAARLPSGRVLVVGDNDLAGLAVVRSLGRAGKEIHLVTFDARPVTRSSRFVSRTYQFGHPLRDTRAFGAAIVALVRRSDFDLVIPTNDAALIALVAERDQIEAHAALAAPDQLGFESTNNKALTLEIARELCVPIPNTVLVSSHDERQRSLGRAFPLVLKPSRSVTPGKMEKNFVRIVESEDQLAEALSNLLEAGPVLVQDFCPGFGIGLCVLARRGKVIAAFQHRRVHEPPGGGASSYRASMTLEPMLLDFARRICRRIELTGPAMFEFKRDPQTDRTVLMEINGRLWGSLALAISAGVDFPRLLYEMQVSDAVTPVFWYRVPHFCRYTPEELYWFRANFRAPAGRRDVTKVGVRDLVRELGKIVLFRDSYDIESLSDPLPALVSWVGVVKQLWRDLRGRLELAYATRRLEMRGRRVRRRAVKLQPNLARTRSILVLCHGNINRSAVAGARLRMAIEDLGLPVQVRSAGFVEDANRPTGERSRAAAMRLGIDLTAHRSSVVTAEQLSEPGLILVMDARNVIQLVRLNREAAGRMIPLGAFAGFGESVAIEDPYGMEAQVFLDTYRRIIRCADELAAQLAAAWSARGERHDATDCV